MKTGHGPNCSCTSCVRHSESERASVQQFIADGSKIDKLFLGKYIPLRERKLLGKLVKTRAVYDDIRTELLSGSSTSVQNKADLRLRKHESGESDGTILEIVDLVDRGKTLSSSKLSECCSCCVCISEGHVHDHSHPHRHHREKVKARHAKKHIHRGSKQSSMTDSLRITDGPRKRPGRFKAKHIHSVPCTCTFDLCRLFLKGHSKTKLKGKRSHKAMPVMDPGYMPFDEYERKVSKGRKAKSLALKSYQTLKKSQTQIKHRLKAGASRSLRKLNQSKTRLKRGLKEGARKSVQMIKMKNEIIKNKVGEMRASMQTKLTRSNRPTAERKFEIKKDSIAKFREKLKNKNDYDDWACEHECNPEECFPEECLKILTENRARRARHREGGKRKKRVGNLATESGGTKVQRRESSDAKIGTSSKMKNKKAGLVKPKINVTISTKMTKDKQKYAGGEKEDKGTKEKDIGSEMKNKGTKGATKVKDMGTGNKNKQMKEITGPVADMCICNKKKSVKSMTDIPAAGSKPSLRTSSTNTAQEKGYQRNKKTKKIITEKKHRKGTVPISKKGKPKISSLPRETTMQGQSDRLYSGSRTESETTIGSKSRHKKPKKIITEKKHRKGTMPVSKKGKPKVSSRETTIQGQSDRSRTESETTIESKSRQAVRISSSFSFSVEFYKDKPSNESDWVGKEIQHVTEKNPKQYNIKKKHKGHNAKKTTQHHRASEVRLKKIMKEAHAGGHALKRCFCTLKLKSKKTKPKITKSVSKGTLSAKHLKGLKHQSTEKVQTKKQRITRGLKPYECEPGVCVPGECDPYECKKRIQRRGMKPAHTNTITGTRSTSSITKSISSDSAKGTQAYSSSYTKASQRSSQAVTVRPLVHTKPKSDDKSRQAVRIGSAFSFSIEFYKDKQSANTKEATTPEKHYSTSEHKPKINTIRKRDKYVDRKERHLKHMHSQKSSSTGKSKYTLTKNSLRRCFCTLKLKPKVKPQSSSKGSMTSHYKEPKIQQDRQTATKHKEFGDRNRKLLPYECEPGICIPDECDPYECLKIINKREGKHVSRRKYDKHSSTENRRTKSASSVTSRSVTPSKTKRVQSTVITYNTKTPARKYKESLVIKKTPREVSTAPSSPHRQAVRIASSFSFNIEFSKTKISPEINTPVVQVRPTSPPPPKTPKNIQHDKRYLKERGSQGDVQREQKSTPMQVDRRQKNVGIGSAMKRCFCTLKLQKKKKEKEKIKEMSNIGTETPILKEKPNLNMATKGTKTKEQNKRKYTGQLKPYECEPNVCVPGECDPYECLERIKKRNHSKELGTSTNRGKMRSGSSLTDNSSICSGTGTNSTRVRRQKTSTKHRKLRKHTISPQPQQIISVNSYPNRSRQAVRVGSQFSFNVEFFKDKVAPSNKVPVRYIAHSKTPETMTYKKESPKVKKIKNTGAVAKRTSISHQESQAEVMKKTNKGTGIKPMLKRCFCTLKLQNKDKHKKTSELSIQKNSKTKPKVYTVSRVTVEKTKLTAQRQFYGCICNSYLSVESTPNTTEIISNKLITKSSKNEITNETHSSLNFKQITRNNKCDDSPLRLKSLEKRIPKKRLQQTIRITSNFSYDVKCLKDTLEYSQSLLKPTIKITTSDINTIKNQQLSQHKLSNLDIIQLQKINPFLKRSFYTMNINTDNNIKRHKLKPYECEPGVCVPYECDPHECQKLIMKRLMRQTSKMSGTHHSKTKTSSQTSHTPHSQQKGQQSKIRLRSTKTTHARKPVRTITYSTHPKTVTQQSRRQRQAVRVGSNFSFSIEFSKDKARTGTKKESKVIRQAPVKTVIKETYKKPKTKGTKVHKPHRNHRHSHSGISMADKGSSISPKLKRCFCTLKLQKKPKHIKKVNPHTSHGTMTPRHTKTEVHLAQTANKGQNTKRHKYHDLDPNECEPGVCTPGECNPFECLKRIKRRKMKSHDTGSTYSSSHSSGKYPKRPHRKHAQSGHHHRRYSSSTATDPKRSHGSHAHSGHHHRRYSSSTATDPKRSHGKHAQSAHRHKKYASSTATDPKRSHGRHTDSGHHHRRAHGSAPTLTEPVKRTVHSMKQINRRERQAVRIGSTFSFSIEFYKDRFHRTDSIQAAAAAIKSRARAPKERMKHMHSRGSSPRKGAHSRDSQSRITHANRGSSMSPRLKRCFCTLNMKNQTTKTHPFKPTATLYTRSMNTRKLKPYECEPGVCVPGECDPYDCDKLIQKRLRRELGTSTDHHVYKSMGSESSTPRARKVKYTTPVQHRRAVKHQLVVTESGKPASQSVRMGGAKQHTVVTESGKSARQAVRMGSNFSFNIEFFKEKGKDGSQVTTVHKQPKIRYEKPPHVKKKLRTSSGTSHDRKSNRSTESQMSNVSKNVHTTMKELKRCFCTLALQNSKYKQNPKNKQHSKNEQNPKNKQHPKNEHNPKNKQNPKNKNPPKAQKKQMPLRAAGTTTKQVYRLEPYECEPHSCIPYPGACDPHICLERIKKRQRRALGTTTGKPRTTSTGSSGSQPSSTKARRVQYRHAPKSVESYASIKTPREIVSKTHKEDHKQAVRIGSNFSFDIEFFKDNSFSEPSPPPLPVQRVPKQIRLATKPSTTKINKNHKKIQRFKKVQHTDSQVISKKKRSTGVSPFIKRCFCTLALQKRKKIQGAKDHPVVTNRSHVRTGTKGFNAKDHPAGTKRSHVRTGTKGVKVILPPKIDTATRGTGTKKKYHKLLPYECEPGVCVPGECDPYRCLERIKRRGMHAKISGTNRPKEHSTGSFTGGSGRSIHTQSKYPSQKDRSASNNHKFLVEEPRFKSIENPFRQSVRISSSFSFNIEFSKGSSFPLHSEPSHEKVSVAPVKHTTPVVRHHQKAKQLHTETRKTKNKGISHERIVHHNNRKSQHKNTKNTSTGVAPLLKRCFCTLKLQKKGKKPKGPHTKSITTITSKKYIPVKDNVNVAVGTKKKYTKLLPYECEPGFCMPGECDPYKCLKRIKARNMKDTSVGPPNAMRKTAGTSARTKNSCSETQCFKDPRKCKNTQCHAKCSPIKRRHFHAPESYSHAPRSYAPSKHISGNRQSLRLGSNFSCNIEFFKDFGGSPKIYRPRAHPPPITPPKAHRTLNVHTDPKKGVNTSQMTSVKTQSKGAGIRPKLKRCFCTLKLQKSPYANRKEIVHFFNLNVKPPLNMAGDKLFSNKTDHVPRKANQPFKCKSRFSISRCNQYKSSAEIKSCQRIRSQQISTEQILLRKKLTKHLLVDRSRVDQFDIYDSQHRMKGKTSSVNYSNYTQHASVKNNALAKFYDNRKDNKNHHYCTNKVIKEENKNKSITLQTKWGQNDKKESGLGKILKKCLRTLNLFKSDVSLLNTTPHLGDIATDRAILKKEKNKSQSRRMKMNAEKKPVPYESLFTKQHTTFPVISSVNVEYPYGPKYKRKIFSNEMKTILPYIPYKFNKHNSNILITTHSKKSRVSSPSNNQHRNSGTRNIPKHNFRFDDCQISNLLPSEKQAHISKKEFITGHNKFSFKNIMSRCTQLFKKSRNSQNVSISLNNDKNCKVMGNKRLLITAPLKTSKTDVLKVSKSDRCPTDSKIVTIPKKSQSLKMTKVSATSQLRKEHLHRNEQGRKKYSRFQSGDAELAVINSGRPPLSHNFNNEMLCYHSQVLYKKDKKYHKIKEITPFQNNKVVQLALTSPKNKNHNRICDDKVICDTRQDIIAGNIPRQKNDSICINDSEPKKGILKKNMQDDKCYCPMPCLQYKEPNQNCPKKTKVVVLNPICNKSKKPVPRLQCTHQNTCVCCGGSKFSQNISGDCPGNLVKKCKDSCEVGNAANSNIKTNKLGKLFTSIIKTEPEPCLGTKGGTNKHLKGQDIEESAPPNTENFKKRRHKKSAPRDKNSVIYEDTEKVGRKGKSSAPCDKCDYNPVVEMKMNSQTMAIMNKSNPLCQKATKPVPIMQCKTKEACSCCSGSKKKGLSSIFHSGPKDKNTKCLEVCETEDITKTKTPLQHLFHFFKPKQSDPCNTCDYNPMLEMRMDSGNMAVLNSKELIEEIKKLKIKKGLLSASGGITAQELAMLHGKSCNCCVCQSYRKGTPSPKLNATLTPKKGVCICGSIPCAQEVERTKSEEAQMAAAQSIKPCICGASICEKESLKMGLRNKMISKSEGKMLKKVLNKKRVDKKKMQELSMKAERARKREILRHQKYKKEDEERKKRRALEDKFMDNQVKKNKNAGDCYLATESALDIGRFSVKGVGRLLRGTSRAVLEPKSSFRTVKEAFEDPHRALSKIGGVLSDSGAASTARRVKTRIGYMRCFSRFIDCLESCALTHCLLHMCSKDPKARKMGKQSKRRRKEPMDFECSLYMASLRKKPWLGVYYKCPWFYTHCISLLHIFQQFTDVLLFILAVLVWSPLLCAMEVCRACMCCTVCTG